VRRLIPLGIVVLTAAVFSPTVTYDFLKSWDDAAMLLYNTHLTSWSPWWAFRSIYFGHWMPLSWLTWTIDAHAWGLWAGGWHAVNVVLHAINAGLVYLIARRLIGSSLGAAFAAVVWAVHPMRLESVAWVTERKDCLSGLFFLLSIVFYLKYVDTRAGNLSEEQAEPQRLGWWRVRLPLGASLLCFALACMAKCIVVILPVMLILLDWAALHRRAWREKIPYVLIAAPVSVMAFYAVRVGVHNMLPWDRVGLEPRLLHVAYSWAYYAWRTVWPSRLSHMIEYTWAPSQGQTEYPIAVLIIMGVAVFLVWLRSRIVTAAVLAYALAVFPQAGLFHNGPQLVANRYSYLASLPLVMLAGAALNLVGRPVLPGPDSISHALRIACWEMRQWFRGAAFAGVIGFTVVTLVHLPVWRNDETLYAFAAESEPTCTLCQDWAGLLAYKRGDVAATRRYFERAIAVSDTTLVPRWERRWGLATVLTELGETEAAIRQYRAYLASVPPSQREYDHERAHLDNARAMIAKLERSAAGSPPTARGPQAFAGGRGVTWPQRVQVRWASEP